MNQTTFDRGVVKGRQEGRQEGQHEGLEHGRREMLRLFMEERFGTLPLAVTERLRTLPMEELLPLGKAVARATSLDELKLG